MQCNSRIVYEEELQMWIVNGWLIPYPLEWIGSPLMAIVQLNKDKMHPMMDN